jgi:hypothetical protein
MFDTDPHRFMSIIFSTWLLFTIQAVFSVGILPSLLFFPMCAAEVWLSWWCFDCAYRTEKFTRYANLRLFLNLGFAPGFTFLLVLIAAYKQLKLGPVTSLLLACIPLLIAFVIYLALYRWRSRTTLLVARGNRVEVTVPPFQNHSLQGGIGAALSTVIYPMVHSYDSPALLLACIFFAISLFMLFYHRVSIASLRSLKEQELKERVSYTFMEVERIRARRAASFIGRWS